MDGRQKRMRHSLDERGINVRVAVVGGKLQGVEAAYLAGKAGWQVLLLDKEASVPAAGLCNDFYNLDVIRVAESMGILQNVDLIIPALENQEALGVLFRCAKYLSIPMAYDAGAYAVSSSKIKSNQLFSRIGVPAPLSWPDCGFPILVKPSGGSGSEGVLRIENQQAFQSLTEKLGPDNDWVMEEFLEGPSFSIEVIGFAGKYKALQITQLHMDKSYDCKRVLAPVFLEQELREQFERTALDIAGSINLNGIMDVEAILHKGQLKVLEIDARLPSQTPTAVYKSTGVNMVKMLGEAFVYGKANFDFALRETRGAVYEHIKVSPDSIEVCGEHIMADAGPLRLCSNFFGADEVITNYESGKTHWVATLIVTGSDSQSAWKKRCEVIKRIVAEFGISRYADPVPEASGPKNWSGEVCNYHDEIA